MDPAPVNGLGALVGPGPVGEPAPDPVGATVVLEIDVGATTGAEVVVGSTTAKLSVIIVIKFSCDEEDGEDLLLLLEMVDVVEVELEEDEDVDEDEDEDEDDESDGSAPDR